ncbi:hypothetical protein MMC21_006403 [Puttea exsequens]|nr:hypothetical protein [Puttea exsequens]
MHLHPLLTLALPALASAQAQHPLMEQAQSWFAKAKSYIPTSVPEAAHHPIGASTAKLASKATTSLTMANYEAFLTPNLTSTTKTKPTAPHEYMVFITGGNRTCGGQCAHATKVFNESAILLGADPTAPDLGYVNCDTQGVLCATWNARPPTVWHFQRSSAGEGQSTPATTIRINYVNWENVTVGDVVALHTGKKFEEGIVYEGYFHPLDGPLKQLGINKIVGYITFGFSLIPSWAFMLIVSMASRSLISRRTGPNEASRQQRGAGTAPLGGAPPANE